MRKYKCLVNQEFQIDEFRLVPIRDKDKFLIMKWRNEQIHHLRQSVLLDSRSQDEYFKNVIEKLFWNDTPDQLLFSFLKDDLCIGYGGLVHINWDSKNAEISFLIDTKHVGDIEERCWNAFLKLLDTIAFKELSFHKIFSYAFDVRPHLYKCLIQNNYLLEGCLKDHYLLEGRYYNVVIHSKFRSI